MKLGEVQLDLVEYDQSLAPEHLYHQHSRLDSVIECGDNLSPHFMTGFCHQIFTGQTPVELCR